MFVLISWHKLQNGLNLPKHAPTQSLPPLDGSTGFSLNLEWGLKSAAAAMLLPAPNCTGLQSYSSQKGYGKIHHRHVH